MKLSIKITGIDELKKGLSDIKQKAVPYAIISALNSCAYGTMQQEQREIEDSFDRPTPFVKKGIIYTKASPGNLTSSIRIAGEMDRIDVARVLTPHIAGGPREIKKSERRLRRFGFMLNDQYITPGPGARLDRYGNISGPDMHRILSAVSAYQEKGYRGKKSSRPGKYYFIQNVGIFQRRGTETIPVIFFTRAPRYEKDRFLFYRTAELYFERNIHRELDSAWKRAMTMQTAR